MYVHYEMVKISQIQVKNTIASTTLEYYNQS